MSQTDLVQEDVTVSTLNPENVDQRLFAEIFDGIGRGIEELKANSLVRLNSENLKKLSELDKVYFLLAPELAKYLEENPEAISANNDVIKNCFSRLGEKFPWRSELQDLGDFHEFGILSENDVFLGNFHLVPYWASGGESYTAIDLVVYLHEGQVKTKPMAKKAITVGSADLVVKSHLSRLADLEQRGIKIAKNYGERGAVIFQDLYHDSMRQVIEAIKVDPIANKGLLDGLVRIAYVLDSSGYDTMKFLDDMIFDGQNFRYVDGGHDLGDRRDKSIPLSPFLRSVIKEFPALSYLTQKFPDAEALIRESYGQLSESEVDSTVEDVAYKVSSSSL